MQNNYRRLMSSGRIGQMELRNRIIMSPMGSNLADEDGYCGERTQSYYEARAEGGAGMVILGSVSVAWPAGAANPRHIAVSNDKYIPGLQQLAERVHKHGCKLALQLQHAGLGSVADCGVGRPLLCSSIPDEKQADMSMDCTPEEIGAMSEPYLREGAGLEYQVAEKEDIKWLVRMFVDAAARAKRAGVDGLEIHGGHGYIISSFLNPSINKRTDEYGGSIENRARLLTEVISGVKERVGRDFPVWCRLDSVEFITTGGISLEDAKRTALLAEHAGADAIHCSTYGDASKGVSYTTAHAVHKPGGFIPYAAAIKRVVSIPVIGVGRIEPKHAEALIAGNEIDFIAMGRKLLADPELPRKILENRERDIRPCIYCYTCISQIFLRSSLLCAVNAQTGLESDVVILPASTPCHVLVVGAGPAGLEAARVAALRGHRVTLCERAASLGGATMFSSVSYPENESLIRYLIRQIRQLSVEVRTDTEVSVDWVKRLNPDAVIVATGAGRILPSVPGIDLPQVLSGDDIRNMLTGDNPSSIRGKVSLFTRLLMFFGRVSRLTRYPVVMRWFSRFWMPFGENIVFVGGGLVAVELAEFFAKRGRHVTILEQGQVFGAELSVVRRWRNLYDLRRLGVNLVPGARLLRIDGDTITHLFGETQERTIAADQVIVTSGIISNKSLTRELEQLNIPILTAGDCEDVSYIPGAMLSGNLAGRTV